MRPLFPSLLVLSLCAVSRAADQPATASASQRIQNAAAVSQDLFAKANVLTPTQIERLAIFESAPGMRFPHPADLPLYLQSRPWSIAYAYDPRDYFATHKFPTVAWPKADDAPALRSLLAEKDPAIRALAAEALATLDLPEDAARIAVLLDDTADAPPVLGNSSTRLAQGFPNNGGSATITYERAFYPRTVQTYAADALSYLTGTRFKSNNAFQTWAKTHGLGRDSFWYWQARIAHFHPSWMSSQPIESPFHDQYVKEIRALDPETEAKIFLIGGSLNSGSAESPFGPNFTPQDIRVRLSRERLLELLDLKNLWPDADMTGELKDRLRARIAFLAPTLLPKEDWPKVRQAVATSFSSYPPVTLISRLLPPGVPADLANVETREGYLQHAFATETDAYRREDLMREMFRTNPEVHLAAIEAAFYTETQASALPTYRAALLAQCAIEPHTPLKTALLLRLINDPRNDKLFTQQRTAFDSDSYRRAAAQSVNTLAGKTLISHELVESLPQAPGTLTEFRRLANMLGNPGAATSH